MNHIKSIILLGSAVGALLLGTPAQSQTLLYRWNFDNATGSGNSLVVPPAVVDTNDGYAGGNMSVFVTSGTTLSTPAGERRVWNHQCG